MTEWKEIQRFTWVCYGCCRQCHIDTQNEPTKVECDHSDRRVHEIMLKIKENEASFTEGYWHYLGGS
jgi:hypothetical protein